jgi:serine/threonine-protein kinase
VPVTPRLFDTLLYLVERRGELVDKRALMDAVWGGVVVEENNLAQSISALRRLLGEGRRENRFIETVPGRGYRFLAEVRQVAVPNTHREGGASGDEVPSMAAPRGTPAAGEIPVTRSDARWHQRIVAAGMIGILSAAIALVVWLATTRGPSAGPVRTIAVLPFKPLLAAEHDEALELGMADTLITRLSASRELVVRPLSSIRKYSALDTDPLAAGRELAVDYVLDGSIHRSGDDLRVTARLMRVADGTAVWAGQMDERVTSVFAVQDAIAAQAVETLALRLTTEERLRLNRRGTENAEAYRLYLLGRLHAGRLTRPELYLSIDYLQQAARIDPGYALAYAALAEAWRALPITSDVRPLEAFPNGKTAALQALALDDTLAEAHATLCFIEMWYDWNWPTAERECQRALALDPNSAEANRAYAVLLSDLGRDDEAVTKGRRARELDPLSPITATLEAHVLLCAGRYDAALARLRETLALYPRFWVAQLILGKVMLQRGQLDEALSAFGEARANSGGNSEPISLIGYTRAVAGDAQGARDILAELDRLAQARYVPPVNVALVYSGLGDTSTALDLLDRAYEERDVRMTFLAAEPKWDRLRSEPRFVALTGKMGLNR